MKYFVYLRPENIFNITSRLMYKEYDIVYCWCGLARINTISYYLHIRECSYFTVSTFLNFRTQIKNSVCP